ncbi:apolipoprotein N-acyltransferase [Sphaerotilus natans subsp. natans DSM 6575]|uniref:Apolipoprotein N-acyltransferase n=1 Tax=Sphaerotilus natans subsp. natans DSM 6575 TaxID=1286631 RepID=A0A059KSK9_9BURK|nr:apolipoprotein N-acyltransferase [Sphaerotilus natans]KDB54078.1 apolipoprotein N-acyltransferase [Sphaerotilus natans subsp. natans DSM 6575]SIQ68169.1 apolipoprotein N-acyltransferase [Sphaerotilus natans]
MPAPVVGLLALGAGGLQALSLAPEPRGVLQVLGAALLAALVAQAAPRRAFVLGALAGVAWLAGTFWWLFISMHRYGNLPAWLSAGAVLALAAALSLYLAGAMALFARWRGRGGFGHDLLLWSALWLLAELARAQLLTGFPWGAAGYAHVDGPLALLAPWLGVHGMGAAGAALGFVLARLVLQPRQPARAAALGLTAALALAPALRGPDFTRATGGLAVTLLQGNVPQDEKFDFSRLPQTLDWHVRALFASTADLVVAPETAIPLLPAQLPQGLWQGLEAHFSRRTTSALVGVPLGDADSGYSNSVVGFGPGRAGADLYRYDKHHLVPFGEFIPWGFRWFVDMMRMPLGDFSRGPLAAPSFAVGTERVGPNICYEDLFGEELATRFVDAAQAPTVLANVSNIGWFGETVAVDQHLQISRLRTLELQRPMVRATNTGATVAIDHRGRVTHRLAPHVRGVLEAQVQGREGTTPFAWWAGRFGLLPLWALGLAVVASTGFRSRHRG